MSKKIRVAFFPTSDASWMGGVNYYKNLFYALYKYASLELEVVIFLDGNADKKIVEGYLPFVNNVNYVKFLNKKKLSGLISKIENRIFGTSYLMEVFLNKFQIDVVSHAHFSGFRRIKSIGWIPDFQHLHLPIMFTKRQRDNRDKFFKRLIEKSDAIFLSSYTAFNDYKMFISGFDYKAKVLQFVSQPDNFYYEITDEDKNNVLKKYNLPDNFFFLPNQFWKHKNHITAFNAVNLSKRRGRDVFLVCTGNLKDYRDIEYIQSLKKFIYENDLDKNILLLGIVPYQDVYALIKFSMAVLNPSFFEGWSSTVEECKSVGKSLIISDIDVHYEQSPDAVFFERNNPESLCKVLESFYDDFYMIKKTDGLDIKKKSDNLDARTKAYADNYLKYIRCVVGE